LTLAWESGAQPVVLLTKADLCDDVPSHVYEVESVAYGVPVHAVSAPHGDGVETVRGYVPGGRTAALLGSSGVGKSTLVNALPGGGLMLDTPGMRELQLWDAESGLEAAFGDVEALATQCRFGDCSHHREPDCAVRAALAGGTLDRERYESWRKLQRELERLERKQDG